MYMKFQRILCISMYLSELSAIVVCSVRWRAGSVLTVIQTIRPECGGWDDYVILPKSTGSADYLSGFVLS